MEITAPFLFFGGPYSNLAALTALRKIAEDLKITPDHCLCSGDIVAYCADAFECVEEIRDWGVHVVMGNCEESLGFNQNDCGCGFREGSACDLLSAQWFTFAQSQLNEDQRSWMRTLPRHLTFTYRGVNLHAIHGGVHAINRFIFASQTNIQAEELANSGADIVLAGHCGIPFANEYPHGLWVNAGVIGMPANDGTQTGWYCVITPQENGLEFAFHTLSYDVSSTVKSMEKHKLTPPYATALQTGLWPNLDILPEVEKHQTGQALNLPTRFFTLTK